MTAPFLAAAAVAGCAVAFSSLDLLRKVLTARMAPLPILLLLCVGQLPLFVVWLWWQGVASPAAGYWPLALASVALNVAANLAFLEAVRSAALSQTVPFLSLTPVFATGLAFVLLGEIPDARQLAGVALVVLGALQINRENATGVGPLALWRAFRRQRGSVLMAMVALLWSLTMPLDKMALARASVQLHALVLVAGVGLAALVVLVARRRVGELAAWKQVRLPLSAAVLAAALAISLQLVAIGWIWVGFVETVKRALGAALAVVFGRLVYGEAVTTGKIVGVLAMGAGVALLLL